MIHKFRCITCNRICCYYCTLCLPLSLHFSPHSPSLAVQPIFNMFLLGLTRCGQFTMTNIKRATRNTLILRVCMCDALQVHSWSGCGFFFCFIISCRWWMRMWTYSVYGLLDGCMSSFGFFLLVMLGVRILHETTFSGYWTEWWHGSVSFFVKIKHCLSLLGRGANLMRLVMQETS